MSFDWSTGHTSLWLSAAAYCDPGSYYTHYFEGYASGFVITKRIGSANQPWYSAEGFIGYRPADSNIYVVFQGTNSIQQWVNNARFKKVKYSWCEEDYKKAGLKNPCEVHSGFRSAQSNVNTIVLNEVSSLLQSHPGYGIVVTGHSLGGALATLQAIEIIMRLQLPVKLFTFGAPREFNNQASSWVSDYIPYKYRITHYQDPVPHMPARGGHGFPVYRHISGEWYEQRTADGTNIFKLCSGFEDSSCAGRWSWTTVPEHHHYYLGYPVQCGLSTPSAKLYNTILNAPPESILPAFTNGTYNSTMEYIYVGNVSYMKSSSCNSWNDDNDDGALIAGWTLFCLSFVLNIFLAMKMCKL